MFAQPTVIAADGGEVLLDEIVGHKFGLISYGQCPALANPLWRALGATRICVLPSDGVADFSIPSGVIVVRDQNDALRSFFAARQGQSVLLRPDRYIAGCFTPAQEGAFADAFAATLGRTHGIDMLINETAKIKERTAA